MADDELPLLDADLGELLESFAPSWPNIGAALLLGLAACVYGALVILYPLPAANAANWDLPWYAKGLGTSWAAVGVFGLLGACLFTGGVALLGYARWLAAHRVDVCAGGFRYAVPHAEVATPWGEVHYVLALENCEHLPFQIKLLYAPLRLFRPKPVSRAYTVKTLAGREFAFDANSIRRLCRFGQLLREQADAHGVAWQTVDLGL